MKFNPKNLAPTKYLQQTMSFIRRCGYYDPARYYSWMYLKIYMFFKYGPIAFNKLDINQLESTTMPITRIESNPANIKALRNQIAAAKLLGETTTQVEDEQLKGKIILDDYWLFVIRDYLREEGIDNIVLPEEAAFFVTATAQNVPIAVYAAASFKTVLAVDNLDRILAERKK